MPKSNFYFLLIAVALYVLCSGTTLRDRVLVQTLHRIEEKSLSEPPERLLFEGAMAGMTHSLDGYSTYIPHVEQKEYEEELDNRFDGIGIVFQQNPLDKRLEIIYPLPESPAFRAGLRSGDTLLRIDGREVQNLSFSEIAGLFKGKPGRELSVTVQPFGRSTSVERKLERAPVLRPSVEGDRIDLQGRRVFHLADNPALGYLRITSFSDRSALEVQEALQRITESKVEGLILDLRDNPGGYVGVSVRIANFFIRPTPEQDAIVSTRFRNGATKYVYRADDAGDVFELPMVVLIDGESASAAEILAACLQDYDRATIVGTRSYGKGTVQEIFTLPINSGILQLTDASYWRPSNRNIHRAEDASASDQWGVTPDPEGLLPVSALQRHAQLLIRERRSNAVCDDAESYLAEFVRRVPEELEHYRKSKKDDEHDRPSGKREEPDTTDGTEEIAGHESDEKREPFVLRGKAPYYDPQLDRAIELLLQKTTNPI